MTHQLDRTAREPRPATVNCVVCGTKMRGDPDSVPETPLCSKQCAEKWEKSADARGDA